MYFKNLYFGNAGADAAGDAIMLPQSSFIGMTIVDDTSTVCKFDKIDGQLDVSTVTLTHAAGKHVEAMTEVAKRCLSNPKNGFVSVVDLDSTNTDYSPTVITNITIA
tara:strand:+ start:1990 stop:2310 length:321 start_codon:yes stop_codon:yes gene_type:complete